MRIERIMAFILIVPALLAGNGLAAAATVLDVIVYPAFGAGSASIIEGRVIEKEVRTEPEAEDTHGRNLVRSMRTLMNKEIPDAAVTIGLGGEQWTVTTDQEGYFRLDIDQPGLLTPGWHVIAAEVGSSTGTGSLLVVPPQNVHGVISDFDDTVVVSEVNSKRQLLRHSLLTNPLQRKAVAGAADVYATLAARNPDAAAAPMFYLSASPRQLHGPIQAFLDHNGFPRGVLITKRVTNDSSGESLRNQVAYKTARIEGVLQRLPHVTFTLIGDDGEQDPEIYHDLQQRYPGRIAQIWIRRVHPDPGRPRIDGQGDLEQLLTGPSP